jgi:hypothetical protein
MSAAAGTAHFRFGILASSPRLGSSQCGLTSQAIMSNDQDKSLWEIKCRPYQVFSGEVEWRLNTEPRVLNSPMHIIKSYRGSVSPEHKSTASEPAARRNGPTTRESRGSSNVIRSAMWKPSIFTFSFSMSHFSARKQVPAVLSSSLIAQTDVLGA